MCARSLSRYNGLDICQKQLSCWRVIIVSYIVLFYSRYQDRMDSDSENTLIECMKKEAETAHDSNKTNPLNTSSTQKFDFDSPQVLSLLNYKSIYVYPMRNLINNVKNYRENLTLDEEKELLLFAAQCIDLTTLSGDDVSSNVERLCYRAVHALDEDALPDLTEITCRAVCVYPARITECLQTLKNLGPNNVKVASVAAGFPSGQYGLKTRLAEILYAVESGANEIDVVINRNAAIKGEWVVVFQELVEMRKACDSRIHDGHHVCMKVIIGAGDLLMCAPNTIYFASIVSIIAGADFVKTSTGKETVNATLSIGYIMIRAILDYYNTTNNKVGFKPAGGIRTYKDALNWLILVKMLLGPEWLVTNLFRFGASGLLDSIDKRLQEMCYKP